MNSPQMPSIYNVQATQEQEEIQRGFITRVYGWMTMGLLFTAAAAFFTLSTPSLLMTVVTNRVLFLGLMLGELALVMVLSAAVNRLTSVVAGMLFFAFALLNGVTLAVVVLAYTSSSVAVSFGVTACTFGIMTMFGFTTQRDLTKIGSLLIMALIGLILVSLVNLFLHNPAIYWITTYVGIIIFVGLVAYDTQRLKKMSLVLDEGGRQKGSIIGALGLYLDFINLFLLLLRVLGKRR